MAIAFMPGGTLAAHLRSRGRLEPVEAARLVAKLARTLERSHALGLVHRDVKPANVLLDENGEPRLADWGMVRDLGRSALTQSGTLVGTPAFMAPEQVRGETAGPAADVFALGVLLHLALADALPYEGATVLEIARAALARRRRPLTEVGVPAALERIVSSCLAPQARERPSAGDLAAALERFALSPVGEKVEGAPRWGRRAAVFGTLLALVAAAAAGGFAVLGTTRPPSGSTPVADPGARPLPGTRPPPAPSHASPGPGPRAVAPPTAEIGSFARGLLGRADEEALSLHDLELLAPTLSGKLSLLAASDLATYAPAIAPLLSAGWTLGRIAQQQRSGRVEAVCVTVYRDRKNRCAVFNAALRPSIEKGPLSARALSRFLATFEAEPPVAGQDDEHEALALAAVEPLHGAAYLTVVAERLSNAMGSAAEVHANGGPALALWDKVLAAVEHAGVLPVDPTTLSDDEDPEAWWAAWIAANAWKMRAEVEGDLAIHGDDPVARFARSIDDLERAKRYLVGLDDKAGLLENDRLLLRAALASARALKKAGRDGDVEARLREWRSSRPVRPPVPESFSRRSRASAAIGPRRCASRGPRRSASRARS
jgi:hypothetical protein